MSDNAPKGTLRASLLEVEPGLYRAQYSGEINPDPSDARDFPDYHIGTDPQGVRSWVEQMARQMGYDGVEWEAIEPREVR
jgi:hypothetical protein